VRAELTPKYFRCYLTAELLFVQQNNSCFLCSKYHLLPKWPRRWRWKFRLLREHAKKLSYVSKFRPCGPTDDGFLVCSTSRLTSGPGIIEPSRPTMPIVTRQGLDLQHVPVLAQLEEHQTVIATLSSGCPRFDPERPDRPLIISLSKEFPPSQGFFYYLVLYKF
jgi:hypothetical protein